MCLGGAAAVVEGATVEVVATAAEEEAEVVLETLVVAVVGVVEAGCDGAD